MGEVLFQPVRATSNARLVMDQIRHLIENENLKSGTRLPSERELAAQFGVSRPTMREAVQSLASLGLVEVRQGIGTFVSASATSGENAPLGRPWLLASRADILALLEVRKPLEVQSARLAALRAATDSVEPLLEQMLTVTDRMEEADRGQRSEEVDRSDLEFHVLLANLSGNRYLQQLVKFLYNGFANRRTVVSVHRQASQAAGEHRAIIEAVRTGYPEAAAAAMDRHLSTIEEAVRSLV